MSRAKKLKEIKNYVDEIITRAPKMHGYGVDFAVLGDSDGDSCLFNGLLASTGLPIGIDGVTKSQAGPGEPMAGMFYRSPIRRSYGADLKGHKAFFSRDMSLGVLSLFARNRMNHHHEVLAKRWLDWIDHNRKCLVKKPKVKVFGKVVSKGGCLVRGPYRFAPDERSIITPAIWAMMGRVWKYRGWDLHSQMKTFAGSDGDISVLEAEKCDLGYQLHLKVVQAYIKLIIGQSKEFSQKVGQIAYDRIPENLFYEFVAKRMVTDGMLDKYLGMCPPTHHNFGHSWTWEKSEVNEERLHHSCGWDFVFMGKILTKYA